MMRVDDDDDDNNNNNNNNNTWKYPTITNIKLTTGKHYKEGYLFVFGATAPRGRGPPHSRGF